MSEINDPKHTTPRAKELLCIGIKDVNIVSTLLAGIGMIERLELDPKLNVPVVQLYSAKATQQAVKQRTFNMSGHSITLKERDAVGSKWAFGGDIAHILRSRKGTETCCEQLLEYAKSMQYSEKEKSIWTSLEKDIRSLAPEFKNYVIKLYGSRLQGLQLKGHSDIDLFVGKPENFFKDPEFDEEFHNDKDVQQLAENLKKHMQTKSQMFANVERGDNNIKCDYLPNNLKCDISFVTGLNYFNAIFIRRMMDVDARAKQVVLFMKYWVEENGIRYYMSAYVTALLVIFYLQTQDILPPGSKCCHGGVMKKVGDWECSMLQSFNENWKKKQDDTRTVTDLLQGFFDYYSKFDFKNKVVCIYTGSPVDRSEVKTKSGNWGLADSMAAVDPSTYGDNILLHVMGPFKYDNAGQQRIGENPTVFGCFTELIKKSSDIIAKEWRRV